VDYALLRALKKDVFQVTGRRAKNQWGHKSQTMNKSDLGSQHGKQMKTIGRLVKRFTAKI
jgi:hypothetical protein